MKKENKNTKPNANAVGTHDCARNTKNIVDTVGVAASHACDICNSHRSNSYPNSDPHSKGITLIASIITIIVMLILVAVSVVIAIKGGLFETTKKATKETEIAKNAEPGTPPEEPEIDTSIYENAPKDTNGLLLSNATYTSDGKTAMVPKGFKIVDGIEGTKSIADGLVIQDKDGNEFVWIPVKVKENDTETSIASFYRSEWANNARGASLTNSTEWTEPYNGYTGETAEYAAMVKSVYENKGFYIGRYEAGSTTERRSAANGTTEIVVKKNQFPYIYVGWGASMSDYTSDVVTSSNLNQGKGAVLLSKEMYQNKDVGVTSTLCYGVQWDVMLDFIKDKKNVSYSGGWGNYKAGDLEGTLKNTGSRDTYSAKNIYDVAGNVWEWTMEANSSTLRVYRGGIFTRSGSSFPASFRFSTYPFTCSGGVGFRVALYIK